MLYQNTKAMAYFLLLALMIVWNGMADSSKDKDECTSQIIGLASCLPYVEGEGKTPAPDCCDGLKTLLNTNKKCLCLIIKDRNDPDLGGIQINVTLALGLPTICNAPANISKCPELLHMDPKSAQAQVFYGSSNVGLGPAPSPSDGASPEGSQARSTTQKSDASSKKGLFGLDVLGIGLLVWFLLGSAVGNFFIWIPM